jgi:hypothetical protein
VLGSRLKFEGSCYVLIKRARGGRLGDAVLGSLHRLGDGGIGDSDQLAQLGQGVAAKAASDGCSTKRW